MRIYKETSSTDKLSTVEGVLASVWLGVVSVGLLVVVWGQV